MNTITVDFSGSSESKSVQYDLSNYSSWDEVKDAINEDMTAEFDQWEVADYGDIPQQYQGSDEVIGEYWEYVDLCDLMGKNVVDAGLELDINIRNIEESYNGEWTDDETFVQDLLEDTGCVPSDMPSYVYIDWERTARDVMYDYTSHNGHYFRN